MGEIDALLYILPAITIAILSFYFFKTYFDAEEKNRKFLLMKDIQKDVTPIRLQAYERIVLLLERIHLPKLLVRISHDNINTKENYRDLLVNTIHKEFEYNLSQQVYVTNSCWRIVESAQYSIIKIIQDIAENDKIKKASDLKIALLKHTVDNNLPTAEAIRFVKAEAHKMW